MKTKNILVIDGQGGGVGRQIIEGIRARLPGADVTAVGTNSIATSVMMKAGANRGGTGENAVVVNCRSADIIVGPLGIVIADSMMGEISPVMATVIGQSPASRLLIPMNMCHNVIVGSASVPTKDLVAQAIDELQKLYVQTDE
jgi:hypothetical protein